MYSNYSSVAGLSANTVYSGTAVTGTKPNACYGSYNSIYALANNGPGIVSLSSNIRPYIMSTGHLRSDIMSLYNGVVTIADTSLSGAGTYKLGTGYATAAIRDDGNFVIYLGTTNTNQNTVNATGSGQWAGLSGNISKLD